MRSVDLAVYADALAAEVGALSARMERARAQLRQAAIEREARGALSGESLQRLEALGYFRPLDEDALACALEAWRRALDALEELQAWVEERLAAEAIAAR